MKPADAPSIHQCPVIGAHTAPRIRTHAAIGAWWHALAIDLGLVIGAFPALAVGRIGSIRAAAIVGALGEGLARGADATVARLANRATRAGALLVLGVALRRAILRLRGAGSADTELLPAAIVPAVPAKCARFVHRPIAPKSR
jgi:hypothetical protein